MKLSRLALACLAAVSALACASADPAAAIQFKVDYSVTIRGFPVGRANLWAELADGRYTVALTGGVSGLARLFSDIDVKAEASGALGEDRPLAETYRHDWLEDGETEIVVMRFSGRGVDAIELQPPIERPERFVPMTAAHRADAVDLLSAFLWPAPAGASAETCARTLPLIDGKRRFDIDFAFSRMESLVVRRDSRHHRAVVCSIAYRPVSGHRIDKKNDGVLSEGGSAEVWLAEAVAGLVLPIKVRLQSRIGAVVMEAIRFEAK